MWYVYIIQCNDRYKSLYTGITNNIQKRLIKHNSGRGAKYTRGKTPVILVYVEEHPTKSYAAKREYEIKQLTRHQKLKLIGENMVPFNVADILGLDLVEAENLLKDNRKTFRVKEVNGEPQPLAGQIIHGRVNLIVVDGKVEAYSLG